MENEIETIDSPNDETTDGENTDSSNSDAEGEEGTEEYTPREKQLYARAKKAEAEAKAARALTKQDGTKSDDFGYDVKAYLKASGIKAEEFDFVKKEMKQSGMDLDSLLDNEYFQAKLDKHRAVSRTEEAAPRGKRSGGAATESVDYWLAKPIDEVPADMRRAVVNAKLEREGRKSQFYNT